MMLPETLGELMVVSVLTGVLSSVVITIVEWLSKKFGFSFDSAARDMTAKICVVVAGVLAAVYTILDPAVQQNLAVLYGQWAPVLNAILAVLLAGAVRFGQQGFHRVTKQ